MAKQTYTQDDLVRALQAHGARLMYSDGSQQHWQLPDIDRTVLHLDHPKPGKGANMAKAKIAYQRLGLANMRDLFTCPKAAAGAAHTPHATHGETTQQNPAVTPTGTAQPDGGVNADIVVEEISPATAKDMLQHLHPDQRNLRQPVVNKYAADMRHGTWQFTGDPIRFDTDGRLIDGQHRLAAVVAADMTVPMVVVRGVSPAAYITIDAGVARTQADRLKASGHVTVNSTQTVATARMLLSFKSGVLTFGNLNVTDTMLATFIDNHPQIHESVKMRNHAAGSNMSITAYTSAHYLLLEASNDPTAVNEFLVTQVSRGIGLAEGAPALALRSRLSNVAKDYHAGSGRTMAQLCFAVSAWNHYRSGNKISRLQAPHTGGWVGNFPRVHP